MPAPADAANNATASIFSDAGQGGKWLSEFFPYSNPHLDGVHAAIGKMLAVYNTGILILAGLLALWAIVTFILDSAHTGVVGGGKHNLLYGPMRLVIGLALLVPLGTGYNGAQIVALRLADAGSGLANSVWKRFTPATTQLDFSHAAFSTMNIDAFLQQALIDESCLAATMEENGTGNPPGTVKIQALYPDAAHSDRIVEGQEFSLSGDAGKSGTDAMTALGSIATEATMMGRTAREIRVHYNRIGNDDYCGSLSLPVPIVPAETILSPDDQTAYAAAYLAVRPMLASYTQRLADGIDAAIKGHGAQNQPQAEQPQESQAYIPPSPAVISPQKQPAAVQAVEVPDVELPVSAWDALIDKFNNSLGDATDRLEHRYIDNEVEKGYSEGSTVDWIWAGSLFFKLTRLSHDDLKLRFASVSGSLPNAQILPADMREDGMLASCPDLRSDVFLPDYHCRPEGKEATLIIKTADQVLHALQSQRGGDALPAIDAGPGAARKTDILSGNLIAMARLDAVVAALTQNLDRDSPKHAEQFDSMFNAVNIGNALYLSASSLFHASSRAGEISGNGSSSLILSVFACLILVPGFFLAVYLPLLPALRFFLGIAAWLIAVFEALVAMPLIALAQIRTQGDGLLTHARQGWFLLLQMLLRPVLMIFGLMAAIAIFDALYGFITWAIWSALLHVSGTGTGAEFGSGIEGMVELLGYLMFWSVLVYFAANLSFNAITAIPDRILLWIGAADMGGGVMQWGGAGGPATSIGAGPAPGILPSAPGSAGVVTSGLAMQQIAQFGGAAGTQSGATANGVGSANVEHFPNAKEVYLPEGPTKVVTTTTTNVTGTGGAAAPRVISGKPKPMPRDAADYVPPVSGGDKKA